VYIISLSLMLLFVAGIFKRAPQDISV